jgi:hypothetical protein
MTTAEHPHGRTGAVLRRWPSALGLLAAGFQIATGANREAVAITVTVATLCYLAAAALARPWVAWAAIAGGSVVVVAGELAGLAWRSSWWPSPPDRVPTGPRRLAAGARGE